MTDKQNPNSSTDTSPQSPESQLNEQIAVQVPEFVYDKRTGEMSITSPTGEKAVVRTTVIENEEEDDEAPIEPLSVEEFKEALTKLDALGLTWSADNPPLVKAKNDNEEASFGNEEFFQLQDEFPDLPREVGVVIGFALMGGKSLAALVGGEDVLIEKAEIVKKLLITNDFRSEFFFKHAIKVPYLSDIDWEVVVKLSEKGVEGCPAVSYGILSLLLREPSSFGFASQRKMVTVAVNKDLVEKFISIFQDIKESLQQSESITDELSDTKEKEGNNTNV